VMPIKEMLKRVRSSQPLNRLTTSTLKGLFEATGLRSEFVIKHLPRTGVTAISLPDGRVLKLDASGDDWIPTQLFWRGWQGYERADERAAVLRCGRRARRDCGVLLSRSGYAGLIISAQRHASGDPTCERDPARARARRHARPHRRRAKGCARQPDQARHGAHG